MLCLKYKKKDFLCIRKSLLIGLVYTALITFILLVMDKIYSTSNEFFLFEFTKRESYRLFFYILLISIVPQRKIRLTLISVLLMFSFLQYVHFEYFGKNIGAIEFYLFFSDFHEVMETLNTIWSIAYIPLAIVLTALGFMYFIDIKLGDKIFKYKYGIHIFLISILILSGKVFYLSNIKEKGFQHKDGKFIYPLTDRHSARNFFVSINYFITGIVPKKLISQSSNFPTLEEPNLVSSDLNRTIILIIGESLRYDTFSLYDNKLTPQLQELKSSSNIFFKKVYAGGTMTKTSVATLINRLKYPGSLEQVNNENNCLFKLAKNNNFNTYFITAHSNKALGDMRDLMCPKFIDKTISRDDFDQYIVPSGYDEDLKKVLSKINIDGSNNLFVLEQRGSHAPYEKQYPSEFNKYTPYENTALYTDHTLANLIKYIKDNVLQKLYILYVSDHGELLGENGKNGHGHLEKHVYEVPFLMYTNSHIQETEEIMKNIDSHFDISNYITSLLGYKTDVEVNEDKVVYILNADLEGFSGYGRIKIIHGNEEQIKILFN